MFQQNFIYKSRQQAGFGLMVVVCWQSLIQPNFHILKIRHHSLVWGSNLPSVNQQAAELEVSSAASGEVLTSTGFLVTTCGQVATSRGRFHLCLHVHPMPHALDVYRIGISRRFLKSPENKLLFRIRSRVTKIIFWGKEVRTSWQPAEHENAGLKSHTWLASLQTISGLENCISIEYL